VDWIGLVRDRDRWRALVNAVMNQLLKKSTLHLRFRRTASPEEKETSSRNRNSDSCIFSDQSDSLNH
jgi:hypothetical protein